MASSINPAAEHPQYKKFNPLWQEINDITSGENLKRYLVPLNPLDTSDENKKRNEQYFARAIFYAIAGWTVSGMVGTMFTKWPKFTKPDSLAYMDENVNGAGQSIYQQSQTVANEICKNSRAGLAVTFPPTDGQISQEQKDSGEFIPTIHDYKPHQIINWNQKTKGSKTYLDLVCTSEVESVEVDFEHIETPIIRERRLDAEGFYFERIWKETQNNGKVEKEWIPESPVYPLDSRGQKLTEILFVFVGAVSNMPNVDKPLMKEIAHINIGLYRNSADFEDNVWFIGQSQPWMSGIDQSHVDLMKKNNMYIGSRTLLGVPTGGQFGIESAPENPLVLAAMKEKIQMMIGLGARFLQPGQAVKTATQVEGELGMQHSVLSLAASNISEAYTKCLKWCLMLLGEDVPDDLQYTISQDFVKMAADAQMLQQMVAAWFQGALPASDLWNWMRKNEFIAPDKTDEDIQEQLAAAGGGVNTPDLG